MLELLNVVFIQNMIFFPIQEDLNMVPLLVKLLKEVGQNIPECLVTLDQERRNMSQSRKKRSKTPFVHFASYHFISEIMFP